MNSVDYIASQAPFVGDYLQAMHAYWQNSRHPENLSEIMGTAKDRLPEGPARFAEYPVLLGTVALQVFEITPANENLLTRVGREHFLETGDVIESALRVGSVTGPLELALGVGMAYSLHKFAPSVDVIKERYLKKPKEKDLESAADKDSAVKRTVGKYGIALSTGASGSVIYTDIVEDDRTFKDNAKTGAKVAALLAANNTLFAAGILYATKSDIPVVADVLEFILDTVSNPVALAIVAGGYVAIKQTVGINRDPKASTEQDDVSEPGEDFVIQYSLFEKIKRKFRKNNNQQAIQDFMAN